MKIRIPKIDDVPLFTRFSLSMIFMFLPLLVFSIGGILTFVAVIDAFEVAIEDANLEMRPITHLQSAIYEASIPIHDYLVECDPAKREIFAQKGLNVDKAFEEAFSAPFDQSDDLRLIQSAHKEWQLSRFKGEDVMTITDPLKDPTTAHKIESFDTQIGRVMDILTQAQNSVTDEMNKQLDYAQVVKRRVFIVILSIFIVGLGIAVLASVMLTRSILYPIRILDKAAEHLAEGDLACRVPFERKDELGTLARTFNMMAARLENSQAALEELATRDPLTDIYNRREFYRLLRLEIKRALRYGHNFSLILFDIDVFKDINDTYGHPVGDRVLTLIAELTTKEVRPGDVVARYGGDEFALILPEATIANALILAERIRKVISSNDIKVNPKQSVKLTLSIGVAEFPIDGKHEEDLIAKADAMLYAAKRQGGNRVCSADTR